MVHALVSITSYPVERLAHQVERAPRAFSQRTHFSCTPSLDSSFANVSNDPVRLQDALHKILQLEQRDFHKIWRMEFEGEVALDAGGVMREFFESLVGALVNPDLGLFKYSEVDNLSYQVRTAYATVLQPRVTRLSADQRAVRQHPPATHEVFRALGKTDRKGAVRQLCGTNSVT